jgi:DNA-binding CsgD family transcriptional regulator
MTAAHQEPPLALSSDAQPNGRAWPEWMLPRRSTPARPRTRAMCGAWQITRISRGRRVRKRGERDRAVTPMRRSLATGMPQGLPRSYHDLLPLFAPTLTERERDVLTALLRRLTYKEIAEQLFISPLTVKRHASSIYRKLGVSGRFEALKAAREMGWPA